MPAKTYATGELLSDAQGPLVDEVDLRVSGLTFLIRRIDLMEFLNSGTWPQPVTAHVRGSMIFGVERSFAASQDPAEYRRAMEHIVRAAVIVPPAELVEGMITAAQVTRAQCRPLFVSDGQEPEADQRILASPDSMWAARDEVAQLEQDLKAKGYAESTAKTKRRALESARERLEKMVVLHWEDVTVLAKEVLDRAPGAARRFRPRQADAVGSAPEPQEDGQAGGPAATAEA